MSGVSHPRLYVDTNILIYLLERHPDYSRRVTDILQNHTDSGGILVTSVVTITEFLAGTTSADAAILQSVPTLQFLSVNEPAAILAAHCQKKDRLRIGDAIHLATAMLCQATAICTNDSPFAKAAKPHITVIKP